MYTLHSFKAWETVVRKNGKLEPIPRTFGVLWLLVCSLFPFSSIPPPSLPSHPLVTCTYCWNNLQPLHPEGSSTSAVIWQCFTSPLPWPCVVLFHWRIHEGERWSPWLGEFQAEGEKEEKEKRLLSLWEFKERKYDVSHTVSISLYFSVRNCASGKIIKGRISLTIMLFVPYLSSTKSTTGPIQDVT